jgi:hypothetical protein
MHLWTPLGWLLNKDCLSTLASVGAAIILLSLPLDLFFQQIVSYPTISMVDTEANATISRTINYNPDDEGEFLCFEPHT